MPTLACPFQGCAANVDNDSEAMCIALYSAHIATHTAGTAAGATPRSKAPPVDRPKLEAGASLADWNFWTARFTSFKIAADVPADKAVHQLLGCLDSDLLKLLYRDNAKPEGLTEENLLKLVKKIAIKSENVWCLRETLHNMKQDTGELVSNYAARLRGQARLCEYTMVCSSNACTEENDFSETVIMGELVRGLADPEIKQLVLSEVDQIKDLATLVKLIEAKECGKRSSMSTGDLNAVNKSTKQCGNCGTNHPRSKDWKDKCPAAGKECNQCGIVGHFGKVCRNKGEKKKKSEQKKSAAAGTEEKSEESSGIEAEMFGHLWLIEAAEKKVIKKQRQFERKKWGKVNESLFSSSIESKKGKNWRLPHIVWRGNKWVEAPAKPPPIVEIKYRLALNDYVNLGIPTPNKPVLVATTSSLGDTGCSSMIAGVEFAQSLGLVKKDLLPVEMSMRAANKTNIDIIGAIIVEIKVVGHEVVTKQVVYIATNATRVFLNREACEQLGLVPENFPHINQIENCSEINSLPNEESTKETVCTCPKRELPPPLPTVLPSAEKDEEKLKVILKDWILKRYASSTFNTCEHQVLPAMTGEPLRLFVDPKAKPTAVHTPSPVPIHHKKEAKAGLDRDTRLGVIEPIKVNTPVEWCARCVWATKSDGSPRRTVDLQGLNAASVRQTHHCRSPYHQVMDVPPGKLKSTFDAWNGFHSVPIHAADRHYTTFITEWGRFQYRMSPQGHKASGDGYTQRFDLIIQDIPDKIKVIDDTLQWSDNLLKCFFNTCQFLDKCGNNGIVLNPKKFQFGEKIVQFVGFEVGVDTIKPGAKYEAAIKNFPRPKTLTDMRSYFGLVEQVAYTFYASGVMAPFRDLLKPSNASKGKIYWDEQLEHIFKESKTEILEAMREGVRMFTPDLPIAVSTDFSKDGLGNSLFQKHCNCPGEKLNCCKSGWKLVAFSSRFTHPAERSYSPVEGEALSAAVGLKKFRHFILGCDKVYLAVDHKPLLKLLGDKHLDDIENERLKKLKERTFPYKFTVVHVPGKLHKVPDAGSRYPHDPPELFLKDEAATEIIAMVGDESIEPIEDPILSEMIEEVETEIHAHITANSDSISTVSWRMVQEATNADPVLSKVRDIIQEGKGVDIRSLPEDVKEYYRYLDSMYVQDDVILYGTRTVIPERFKTRVLDTLHSAHQGCSQMWSRAETSVFWPGLSVDIDRRRKSCRTCREIAPSLPNLPPHTPQDPEFPFQEICSDYFKLEGSTYLVTVDRLTGWPDVRQTSRGLGGAKGLKSLLRDLFGTFGIPESLTSDGGPEFTAGETANFLKIYDVAHRFSSVGNPHGNQRAEAGVKSMKRLIRENTNADGKLDNERFTRAILQYRNTPQQSTGLSPAMYLFGRQLRDFLPLTRENYKPGTQWIIKMKNREEKVSKSKESSRVKWSEHTRHQKPLKVGDKVSVQNLLGNKPLRWDRTGLVVEVRQFDQYGVKIDGTGRITFRNRKHLRLIGQQNVMEKPLARTPQPHVPDFNTKPIEQMARPSPTVATPAMPIPTTTSPRPATSVVMMPSSPPATVRMEDSPATQNSPETPRMRGPTSTPRRDLTVSFQPPDSSVEKTSNMLKRLLPCNAKGKAEDPLEETRRGSRSQNK